MREYIAYDDSGIEELGDVSKGQVLSLIEQAVASLANDKQFAVGFCRRESDFLEIRPVWKSQYMIWSDRLVPRRLRDVSRVKRHIEKVVIGREAAHEAVLFYMDDSREAFEARYT